MRRIIFTKNYKGWKRGSIDVVSTNVAFGLCELGVAEIYSRQAEKILRRVIKKEIRRPKIDKMMRAETKIDSRKDKKGRYVTK